MRMKPRYTSLITATELQALQRTPGVDVLVVDCRFNLADTQAGQTAWQQGRIAGAVYAHLDQTLSGTKTGNNGRHPLPDWADWQSTLQAWGLTDQTQVVAYDDAGGMFAARLWWMLQHWSGHASVAVLDGGWPAWLQAQAAIDALPATRTASDWSGQPHDAAVVTLADVAAHIGQEMAQPQAMQLLDARAPDRFAGQNETLDPIGGHIPGAQNRFFKLNLQDNGHFKPTAMLREEFTQWLGERPTASVVHQCGSGVTACHNMLAMAHAGLSGSRLYPGSWSEWCADASRPMVTASA